MPRIRQIRLQRVPQSLNLNFQVGEGRGHKLQLGRVAQLLNLAREAHGLVRVEAGR
jgi:hypothetical protein